MEKHLMLVGMPGSGKTTLGRKWAVEMHVPLYEIDEMLEEKFGMSISEFVSLHGWEAFRDAEWNEIKEVLQKPMGVVVPGAGFFTNELRVIFALSHFEVTYLRVSLEELLFRFNDVSERSKRPLLNNKNWKRVIEEMYDQRIHFYQKAHAVVSTN